MNTPQPTIHPLVKAIALTVFILLPFIGFYAGIKYQQSVSTTNQISPIIQPVISAQPLVHKNTTQPTPLPTTDPLTGWLTYTNSQYRFFFQYPPTFQPVSAEQPYFFRATPLFTVRKIENNEQTIGYTQDSTIAISVDQNTTTCGLDPRDQSIIRGLTVLNGTNFFMGGTGGAAAGNHYTSVFYRTTQDKTCIEITTTVHVSTDGNSVSPTEETKLVDQAKEELARIVDTMKFANENQTCASLDLPRYKLAYTKESGSVVQGVPAEFHVDLDGDGTMEFIRLYLEQISPQNAARTLPAKVRIFSRTSACYQEVFTYSGGQDGRRSGNEMQEPAIFPNFWGDGRTVLLFFPESTGYGSGFNSYMNFITVTKGQYEVVFGPTLSEVDSYYLPNINPGTNAQGKTIVVARGLWGQDETHFSPHRYTLELWTWDGKKYTSIILGDTENKYEVGNAKNILYKEPKLLKLYQQYNP